MNMWKPQEGPKQATLAEAHQWACVQSLRLIWIGGSVTKSGGGTNVAIPDMRHDM